VATGGGRLVALSVVAADARPLAPCGPCRQLLVEHGEPGLLLDLGPGTPAVAVADLLPAAFTGADLAARRDPT